MYDPKKVLEICAAATRGPWVTNVKHYEHCIVSKPLYDEGINYLISGRCCLSQDDDFVVLARTALPEFAQRVIELEAKSATLLAIAEAAQEVLQKEPTIICPRCDGSAGAERCVCEPWELLRQTVVEFKRVEGGK